MVFNTGLVQNLGHIIVFLELWAQLFKENLGTCGLAIKLEGTQVECITFPKISNMVTFLLVRSNFNFKHKLLREFCEYYVGNNKLHHKFLFYKYQKQTETRSKVACLHAAF